MEYIDTLCFSQISPNCPPGDTNLIAILDANVEYRVVIVDNDGIGRERIERCPVLIALGQRHNVVDAAIGSGVATRSLTDVCVRPQVGRDDFDGVVRQVFGNERLCGGDDTLAVSDRFKVN
jgi:hypothetical protein